MMDFRMRKGLKKKKKLEPFYYSLTCISLYLQQNHVCSANWEHIPDGQLQQRRERPARRGQGGAATVQRQQRHHVARHRAAPAQGLHSGAEGVLQRAPVSGPIARNP